MLTAIFLATFAGCTTKADAQTTNIKAFMLNQSVVLASEMQNAISAANESAEVESDRLTILGDMDLSAPQNAVILPVDTDITTAYLSSEYLFIPNASDELVAYLTPSVTRSLGNFALSALNDNDNGYNLLDLFATLSFSATHISQAPEGLTDAVVFMTYANATSITLFSRYDDYVQCTCSLIIPDISADELLQLYDDFFETHAGTPLIAGHTIAVETAELDKLLN